MPAGDLEKLYTAMGFEVIVCDRACAFEIAQAVQKRKAEDRPLLCLLYTIGGKGVSYMENDPFWHDEIPTGELRQKALTELTAQKQKASSWKTFLTQMKDAPCRQ